MILKANRLILRPWEEKDIPDIVEGLNNYNVSKWLALVKHPYAEADARDWIRRCQALKDAYEWAMDLNGKAIGGISLKIKGDKAEGGIWLSEKYHGHGYGREAWDARNRYAFEAYPIDRLESGYFIGNEPSRILHERSGYKPSHVQDLYSVAQGKLLKEQRLILRREDWRS